MKALSFKQYEDENEVIPIVKTERSQQNELVKTLP